MTKGGTKGGIVQRKFRDCWPAWWLAVCLCYASAADSLGAETESPAATPSPLDVVLEHTRPLCFPRGDRLPLYLWPVIDLDASDEARLSGQLRALDERGIAAISSWNPAAREQTLAAGKRVGRIQQRLRLPIAIHASAALSAFCNGAPETAHVDDQGRPFFDESFGQGVKMGCPFALDHRKAAIRGAVEDFAQAYRQAGLDVSMLFVDWEIDGPIEWNGAWASSKRCRRCREQIPNIGDFSAFQAALRRKRAELERKVLAEPARLAFPRVLVGNYGVTPHDGYRYWYDYFETFVEGAPYRLDGRARYRKWFDEFPLTGYTMAMPVVYTWYATPTWYDFGNLDYRWFYNLLLEGSSVGRHTPRDVPLVTFVHWHTTAPPPNPDPAVRQFSARHYQELLWHLLLRGHDTFFVWCLRDETAKEVELVHEVYRAALEYAPYLDQGEPVNFEVPRQPGPVVSGLRLGGTVLVRRTDFEDHPAPLRLTVDNRTLEVPVAPGRCQILCLPQSPDGRMTGGPAIAAGLQ